jgi:hypothetical protein
MNIIYVFVCIHMYFIIIIRYNFIIYNAVYNAYMHYIIYGIICVIIHCIIYSTIYALHNIHIIYCIIIHRYIFHYIWINVQNMYMHTYTSLLLLLRNDFVPQ